MTKEHAAELLDLVIARAPKLRAAGVLELAAEGLVVKLAPAPAAEPAAAVDAAKDDEDDDIDPWNDPTTFGRRKGVPGKDRRKE